MNFEVPAGHEQRADSVAYRGAELLGRSGPHIAGGEDARHGRLHRWSGREKPAGITLEGVPQEGAVRPQANEHEGRCGGEPEGLATVAVAGHDGCEPAPPALEFDDVDAG